MMKKLLVGVLSSALLVSGAANIVEAKGGPHGHYSKGNTIKQAQHERNDAAYILQRTTKVIYAAKAAAMHRHHYFGMAKAVAHQQKARELYWKRLYREAIFHSLRARKMAFDILEANRERPRREYYRNNMEERYGHVSPRENDLDMRIDLQKVGDDYKVTRFELNLDL